MATKKKAASKARRKVVKQKRPAARKRGLEKLAGPEVAMFADSRDLPDIPVFVEFVVDVPRAVIRGTSMVTDGNAMNVWIMQSIEHLIREP